MITRRTLTLMLAAAAATAGAPATEMVTLDQLSGYCNDLTTLRARFQQFNDDGSTSSGTLYIRRRGARGSNTTRPPQRS